MNDKPLTVIIGTTPNSHLLNAFIQEVQTNFSELTELAHFIVCTTGVDMFNKDVASIIASIDTEFVLCFQESMFLYDMVDSEMFKYYLETMKQNPRIVSLRLARGGISQTEPQPFSHGLYQYAQDEQYPFCLYYTIWRRDALNEILTLTQNSEHANQAFKQHNLQALFAYNETDTKRGMYHWENQYFPFMNTGIVNGEWNNLEYSIEIENLKREYSV
jgi:hypothetical protein